MGRKVSTRVARVEIETNRARVVGATMTTSTQLIPGLGGNAIRDEQELTKYLERPNVMVLPSSLVRQDDKRMFSRRKQ